LLTQRLAVEHGLQIEMTLLQLEEITSEVT